MTGEIFRCLACGNPHNQPAVWDKRYNKRAFALKVPEKKMNKETSAFI